MPDRYLIHPAIGIARVGNSTDLGYDGPERYDQDFQPRDAAGTAIKRRDAPNKIRRQAAVFKIYKYTYSTETNAKTFGAYARAIEEITLDKVKSISWIVHIANRKSFVGAARTDAARAAAGKIDPGPHTITATKGAAVPAKQDLIANAFPSFAAASSHPPVKLGEISADATGHLRVLGGHGTSGYVGSGPQPVPTNLENQLWYDDVADGWVEAKVTLADGATVVEPVGAWVVTGAPGFAHAIEAPITVYERVLDVAARGTFSAVHGVAVPSYHPVADIPSFTAHIWRVLRAAEQSHWTSGLLQTFYGVPAAAGSPQTHHFADRLAAFQSATPDTPALKAARQRVFDKLRDPGGGGTGNMPFLHLVPGAGDTGLTLLDTQYKFFKKWLAGTFDADWPAGPKDSVPRQLDYAHMRAMLGGAFYPGIEVGKNMADVTNWSEPFRIKHKDSAGTSTAGLMTATLAVPWQSDFTMCAPDPSNAGGWWPSHRPDSVLPEGAASDDATAFKPWFTGDWEKMRLHWHELGFLKKAKIGAKDVYVETERVLPY